MTSSIADGTREYLSKYIAETATSVSDELAEAEADVRVIAQATEALAAAPPIGDHPTAWPGGELERHPGGFLQNRDGPWPSLTVWQYLLGPDGKPRPEVAQAMARTAPLDFILPALADKGRSRALQVYVLGGRGVEYTRLAPWADLGGVSEKLYPGTWNTSPWDRFWPGLMESWQKGNVRDVTYTAPYDDAAGGGLVISVLRPVWHDGAIEAVAGVDIPLSRLVKRVSDIRLLRSGFAVLVQESGNVVAANADATAALRLGVSRLKPTGVNVLSRNLADSAEAAIVALTKRLRGGGDVSYEEISFGGARWVLALRKVRAIPMWSDATGLQPESWTLLFLVPRDEIYGGLASALAAAEDSGRRIVTGQIALAVVTLLLVVLAITVVVRKTTAPLTELARAAADLGRKSHDVQVVVPRDPELGEVARAFNDMAATMRDRTRGLEALVAERTDALHRSLDSLWGEMSLAHKIQTVLLPNGGEELGVDVAATMKPAETVGGDYYDYFRAGDADWVLIGDVSDHGVAAGLIMMMAQTAVRTAATAGERSELGPARLLAVVNEAIRANVEKIGLHQYMTVCALRIAAGGKVTFAGLHLDLLVWRAGRGEVERVATHGVWLGLVDDISEHLPEAQLELAEGDLLLLYTDGLTEVQVDGAMFGAGGVARLFGEVVQELGKAATARAVVDRLYEKMPADRYEDDATVVVVGRKG